MIQAGRDAGHATTFFYRNVVQRQGGGVDAVGQLDGAHARGAQLLEVRAAADHHIRGHQQILRCFKVRVLEQAIGNDDIHSARAARIDGDGLFVTIEVGEGHFDRIVVGADIRTQRHGVGQGATSLGQIWTRGQADAGGVDSVADNGSYHGVVVVQILKAARVTGIGLADVGNDVIDGFTIKIDIITLHRHAQDAAAVIGCDGDRTQRGADRHIVLGSDRIAIGITQFHCVDQIAGAFLSAGAIHAQVRGHSVDGVVDRGADRRIVITQLLKAARLAGVDFADAGNDVIDGFTIKIDIITLHRHAQDAAAVIGCDGDSTQRGADRHVILGSDRIAIGITQLDSIDQIAGAFLSAGAIHAQIGGDCVRGVIDDGGYRGAIEGQGFQAASRAAIAFHHVGDGIADGFTIQINIISLYRYVQGGAAAVGRDGDVALRGHHQNVVVGRHRVAIGIMQLDGIDQVTGTFCRRIAIHSQNHSDGINGVVDRGADRRIVITQLLEAARITGIGFADIGNDVVDGFTVPVDIVVLHRHVQGAAAVTGCNDDSTQRGADSHVVLGSDRIAIGITQFHCVDQIASAFLGAGAIHAQVGGDGVDGVGNLCRGTGTGQVGRFEVAATDIGNGSGQRIGINVNVRAPGRHAQLATPGAIDSDGVIRSRHLDGQGYCFTGLGRIAELEDKGDFSIVFGDVRGGDADGSDVGIVDDLRSGAAAQAGVIDVFISTDGIHYLECLCGSALLIGIIRAAVHFDAGTGGTNRDGDRLAVVQDDMQRLAGHRGFHAGCNGDLVAFGHLRRGGQGDVEYWRHGNVQLSRIRTTLSITDGVGHGRNVAIPVRFRHEAVAAVLVERQLTHAGDAGSVTGIVGLPIHGELDDGQLLIAIRVAVVGQHAIGGSDVQRGVFQCGVVVVLSHRWRIADGPDEGRISTVASLIGHGDGDAV